MNGVHRTTKTIDHLDLEEATERHDLNPPSQKNACFNSSGVVQTPNAIPPKRKKSARRAYALRAIMTHPLSHHPFDVPRRTLFSFPKVHSDQGAGKKSCCSNDNEMTTTQT